MLYNIKRLHNVCRGVSGQKPGISFLTFGTHECANVPKMRSDSVTGHSGQGAVIGDFGADGGEQVADYGAVHTDAERL